MKHLATAFAALTLLGACSAQEVLNFAIKNRDLLNQSGGSNQYDVYDDEFGSIATASGITSTTIPAVPVPSTGTARFEGVAQVTIATTAGDGRLAGDLTLDADFVNDTVTGDITGVVDSAGESYTSDLDIAGRLDDAGTTPFDARLTGTLVDGQSNTWTTDAQMEGAFAGSDAEYVGGTVNGTAEVDGAVTTIAGQFIAIETSSTP